MAANGIKSFENKYGVRFCFDHTGKMENMFSLSTSVLENKICAARAKVKVAFAKNVSARKWQKDMEKVFRTSIKPIPTF